MVAKANKKFEGVARELIALRIANELQDGAYVNLGIGIPTLVSNWIEGRDIVLQARDRHAQHWSPARRGRSTRTASTPVASP